VVAVRDGPEGIEVLMLRRARDSRFAPGFSVFPGGSIEEGDEGLATRWFGDPSEAARACAVRELAEESGLTLTAGGLRPLVAADRLLATVSADPPPPTQLAEIARWVAPEFLEVRFDARFFALEVPRGLPVRPDGLEVERAWWSRPADVLSSHGLYRSLMWPTYRTLEALAACGSAGEVLRIRVRQVPPPAAIPIESPERREPRGRMGA
jgi:8-oxo-dGTP pyrophosphatase MutT (NUDIX family)